MAEMTKATFHCGRSGPNGVYNANHNTLEATRQQQPHIDQDRFYLNEYYRLRADGRMEMVKGGKGGFNSKKHEREYYEKYFSEGLRKRNEQYQKKGHKQDCKSIKNIYEGTKTAPYEILLQVGNMKTDLDPKEQTQALRAAWKDWANEMTKQFGKNFKILDGALHMDESTPHIHVRSVFVAPNKDGDLMPNQSQALKAMGFKPGDPDKTLSKFNNVQQTFTAYARELFYQAVERQGITVNREVENPSQKDLTAMEYKCEKLQENIEEMEHQMKQQREELGEATDALRRSISS